MESQKPNDLILDLLKEVRDEQKTTRESQVRMEEQMKTMGSVQSNQGLRLKSVEGVVRSHEVQLARQRRTAKHLRTFFLAVLTGVAIKIISGV